MAIESAVRFQLTPPPRNCLSNGKLEYQGAFAMHLDRRQQYRNTNATESWFIRGDSFTFGQNSVTIPILMQMRDSKVCVCMCWNAWKRECRVHFKIELRLNGWTWIGLKICGKNLTRVYLLKETVLLSRNEVINPLTTAHFVTHRSYHTAGIVLRCAPRTANFWVGMHNI